MAEIEHFVDPTKKAHPKFADVKDQKLALLPKETQMSGSTELTEITIGEAVEKVRSLRWLANLVPSID